MKVFLLMFLAFFTLNSTYAQVKATSAELNTGTDDDKFATALALQGSKYLDQSGAKIFAVTAAGANTYTATITPAITAYNAGQLFYIKITTANTAAATLNLNGLGAKALVQDAATPLVAGDLLANKVYAVYYDGTNFQVMNATDVLKANLASPAFTGTPTAPTATVGTNTTQIATTAFVTGNFAPLSGGGNYINNQTTTQSANFNINGVGYLGSGISIGPVAKAVQINLDVNKVISGSTSSYGVRVSGQIQSDVTSIAAVYSSVPSTQASAFNLAELRHFIADQGAFGPGSTVGSQYGFYAGNTLLGAINNYGFYGNIGLGTGRWNVYVPGTASNYYQGFSGFGISSPLSMVHARPTTDTGIGIIVQGGTATQSGNLQEWRNSSGTILSSVSSLGEIKSTQYITAAGIRDGINTSSVTTGTIGTNIYRNIADGNSALKVNSQAGTGYITQFQQGGVTVSAIDGSGRFRGSSLANLTSLSNSEVLTNTTGTLVFRNVADGNAALIVNSQQGTGAIQSWQQAGISVASVSRTGEITANAFIGNVSTATKLQTARSIWGATFDGTANITGALSNVSNITGSGDLNMAGNNSAVGRIKIGHSGGDYGTLGHNVAFTGTSGIWNYSGNDFASFFRFKTGGLEFFTAPVGTAGSSMTPTNVLSISQVGDLTISGKGTFTGAPTNPTDVVRKTELDLKANLASPALTGIPSAPTATAGTNTTQLATTAYVVSTISSNTLSQPLTGYTAGTNTTLTATDNLLVAFGKVQGQLNARVSTLTATNGTGQTWTITNPTTAPAISLALTKAAVGLAAVDNTADLSKPVSTATQTAITAVDVAAVHKTGNETITGIKLFSTNVGIGTTNTQGYKLAVGGNMIAESVKVKLQTAWPDYVFEKDHKLLPLNELEKFISNNKHLPDVPKAEDVKKDGINLGQMDAKLLQKIEELTLYIIELKKDNDALKNRMDKLEKAGSPE